MNRTAKASLLLAGVASLYGCHQTLPEPGRPKWADEIARNKELWSKADLPNYQLLITWAGPTIGRYSGLVTVQAGKVVSVVDPASGVVLQEADAKVLGKSIDTLFEILIEADRKPRATISATFDAALGYPKRFEINWNRDFTDAIESAEIELQYPSGTT
jgi:hypothetical protein